MAGSTKLLRLPDRGRLLVAADLHGNLRDFLTLSARFEALGDDGYLLLLGDLLHGPLLATSEWTGEPPLFGRPYRDQSPAVLFQLTLLEERYPGRVFLLLGNHEHAHIGGPRTSLFARDDASALEARLGVENSGWLASRLRSLPLWALSPSGILFSHAAPAAELRSVAELEDIDYRRYLAPRPNTRHRPSEAAARLLGQALWSSTLTPFKAQGVLAAVGAQLAVYGHSVIPGGYQTIGYEQLLLSTSFGMSDADKHVLLLDLSARYESTLDLRPGHELLPLYPR